MAEITPTLGLSAYFLGRRIAGQRKRVPVAYLYNGVRLPALPEWDKSKYPYAAIGKRNTLTNSYSLHLSESPSYRTGNVVTDAPLAWWGCYDGETWTDQGVTTEGNRVFLAGVCWSNHDILNKDGTVYLAASDPEPVYE